MIRRIEYIVHEWQQRVVFGCADGDKAVHADSDSIVAGELVFHVEDDKYGNAGVGGANLEVCSGLKGTICCSHAYSTRNICRCGYR